KLAHHRVSQHSGHSNPETGSGAGPSVAGRQQRTADRFLYRHADCQSWHSDLQRAAVGGRRAADPAVHHRADLSVGTAFA
nr:hypothetical protein [Tanacetum cinerariifolium]